MYAAFFGLREPPFNNTPDPRFFFTTPDHEEALASLIYAVGERKGFVLLTGEVGAGKTLVSRMMLRHFGERIVHAHIHHAVTSADDLIEAVCQEFELAVSARATRTQRVRVLHDFLIQQFSQNVLAVLVLDEAQNLPVDAFEQLRMVGNLEADDAKLLQVVIVGQPELRSHLASADLRQLNQRIFRGYHLPAMTPELTDAYVRHRLAVAGAANADIFDAAAMHIVFRFSRGLPRVVNTICDNSMLHGYAANRLNLDGAFVESAVRQMTLGGPSDSPNAADGPQHVQDTLVPPTLPPPKNLRVVRPASGVPTGSVLEDYGNLARRATAISTRFRSRRRPLQNSVLPTDATEPADTSSLPNTALSLEAEKRIEDACLRLGRLRHRFLSVPSNGTLPAADQPEPSATPNR